MSNISPAVPDSFKSKKILFVETVGGDFNFDNMSPSDVAYNQHPLFSIYRDPCMKEPGQTVT